MREESSPLLLCRFFDHQDSCCPGDLLSFLLARLSQVLNLEAFHSETS